jgi:hypothetical protein
MKQRTFGFATPEELSHHSIPEKGPRVVRGTPQGKQGEGGSDSIAPLNISPFTTLFGNGTRNFADGTHNFPNGTLFYQRGPDCPQMGPYLAGGTHVYRTGIPASSAALFVLLPVQGRLQHLPPAVAIRRSCSKRVLGAGRYRTRVLLV